MGEKPNSSDNDGAVSGLDLGGSIGFFEEHPGIYHVETATENTEWEQ